jgi:hypothetical protein
MTSDVRVSADVDELSRRTADAAVTDPKAYPAGVRSAEGTLTWWVDREAAALYTDSTATASPRDDIGPRT